MEEIKTLFNNAEIADLSARIETWSDNLGLNVNSDPIAQLMKLREELGEFAKAIQSNDLIGQMDGLGDTIVVATVALSQIRQFQSADVRNKQLFDVSNKQLFLKEYGIAEELPTLQTAFYNFDGAVSRLAYFYADSWKQRESGHFSIMMYERVIMSGLILARKLGFTLEESLKMAYSTIHFRSGEIVDGIFVKKQPEKIILIPAKMLKKDIDTIIKEVLDYAQQSNIKYFKIEYYKGFEFDLR